MTARHGSLTYRQDIQFFFNDFTVKYCPRQTSDPSPTEHVFDFLKTRLKAERPQSKQEVKMLPVQDWQSITREDTKSLQKICNQVFNMMTIYFNLTYFRPPTMWRLRMI